ncbi:hypothetical protein NHQ30_002349 [Ciborinia camelliae]|nr:hypothetical protein NHQ30_002349 [Ciborinia camelliae]
MDINMEQIQAVMPPLQIIRAVMPQLHQLRGLVLRASTPIWRCVHGAAQWLRRRRQPQQDEEMDVDTSRETVKEHRILQRQLASHAMESFGPRGHWDLSIYPSYRAYIRWLAMQRGVSLNDFEHCLSEIELDFGGHYVPEWRSNPIYVCMVDIELWRALLPMLPVPHEIRNRLYDRQPTPRDIAFPDFNNELVPNATPLGQLIDRSTLRPRSIRYYIPYRQGGHPLFPPPQVQDGHGASPPRDLNVYEASPPRRPAPSRDTLATPPVRGTYDQSPPRRFSRFRSTYASPPPRVRDVYEPVTLRVPEVFQRALPPEATPTESPYPPPPLRARDAYIPLSLRAHDWRFSRSPSLEVSPEVSPAEAQLPRPAGLYIAPRIQYM